MKKTFNIEPSEISDRRQVDYIKSEIKKYIVRERKKELPEGFDFWFFNCKFGTTEESAKTVFANELKACIDKFIDLEIKSFYVEILSSAIKDKNKVKSKNKNKKKGPLPT